MTEASVARGATKSMSMHCPYERQRLHPSLRRPAGPAFQVSEAVLEGRAF
jgi:hypothetical protein